MRPRPKSRARVINNNALINAVKPYINVRGASSHRMMKRFIILSQMWPRLNLFTITPGHGLRDLTEVYKPSFAIYIYSMS